MFSSICHLSLIGDVTQRESILFPSRLLFNPSFDPIPLESCYYCPFTTSDAYSLSEHNVHCKKKRERKAINHNVAERSRKVARSDLHSPGNGSGNILAPQPDDNDIVELSASLPQTNEETNIVTGEVALGNSSRKQHLVTSPFHRIIPILPEDDELLITKLCVAITRWVDKVGEKPFNYIIHYLRKLEF